jgi:type IV pilus assembly protein PilP
MKKIEFLLLAVIFISVVSFTGCKKSPVPKVVAKNNMPAVSPVKQTPPPPVQAAPPQSSTMTETSTYYYNPAGKPDPFEPFDISKVKPTTTLTPLQQFSLDQLTVRGIIWGLSNAKAIIEDPTGKTYIVGIGTKIGKNNGVIIRILNDKIVVLEQYTDVFTGKVKTNEVTMELKKTEKI